MSTGPIRVRFAPSPTGYLHLGGLRTALFNYLFARSTERATHEQQPHDDAMERHEKATPARVIMRIEDTDQTRSIPQAAKTIYDALSWCGIHFDESPFSTTTGPYGPYQQSERLSLYRHYATELLRRGAAYKCYCTKDRLEALRRAKPSTAFKYDQTCRRLLDTQRPAPHTPYVIRLRVPDSCASQGVTVSDLVLKRTRFYAAALDDVVLLKADGWPTYHLASVVDDHLMCISHVLRGQEWHQSTPLHLLLYDAFGWTPPRFGHLPLLHNADHSKLSKRQEHANVLGFYRERGFLGSALVNYCALLGWTPNSSDAGGASRHLNQEGQSSHHHSDIFFNMQALIDKFKLQDVHKNPAIVDLDKLRHINRQHILHFSTSANNGNKSLVPLFVTQLRSAILARSIPWDPLLAPRANDDLYMEAVIQLFKARVSTIPEIVDFAPYMFFPVQDGPKLTKFYASINTILEQHPSFNLQHFMAEFEHLKEFDLLSLKLFCEKVQLKFAALSSLNSRNFFLVLRYLVTGSTVGAPLLDTMVLLGKDVLRHRLANFIQPSTLDVFN